MKKVRFISRVMTKADLLDIIQKINCSIVVSPNRYSYEELRSALLKLITDCPSFMYNISRFENLQ